MRKTLIALVFLVLMTLAIARASEEPSIPSIDGHVVTYTADPSTIPEPQGTSEGEGIPFTTSISPDRTYQQVYYTLQNTHYNTTNATDLVCSSTGYYDIVLDFYLTNPSYKWACAVHPPLPLPIPYTCLQGPKYGYTLTVSTNDYLGNFWSNLTWSAQNLWVCRVRLNFTVISTPATIRIYLRFNQMWTDLNSDLKVDMKDIGIVAKHYETVYQPGQSILEPWNIVIDNIVDLIDIAAITNEFGRPIPP